MLAIYLIISSVLIGVDQWVKYLTVTNIQLGESINVIPGFLSLTYIRNTGAAWSLLEGKMWFFYSITLIVVLGILYVLIKKRPENKWFGFGLSLFLAGAVGNFIDRLRLSYVVDMFQTDFMNFPIFNVADMALVVGVICIFIYLVLDEKAAKDGTDGTN